MKTIPFLSSLVCMIVLCLIFTRVYAQPNAHFTASITDGCAPQPVSFTLAQPDTSATYYWIFGNGNISTLLEPNTTYPIAGSFEVKLKVTKNGVSAQQTKTLDIFDSPHADFFVTSGQTFGCVPFPLSLSDNSTPSGLPITKWVWDFGDGQTTTNLNGSDVSHEYFYGGSFSMSLTVYDNHGCSDFASSNFEVFDKPNVNFTVDPSAACSPPDTFNFTNLTTGSPPFNCSWDFGNGNTSTAPSPMGIIYNNWGVYPVKLIVENNHHCIDSLTKSIVKIQNPVANFTMSDTACFGHPVQFINTSADASSFEWTIEGSTYGSYAPLHTFSTSGHVNITLKASTNAECFDLITKTIFIDKTEASFSFSPDPLCTLPLQVNFTNTTQSNNSASGTEYLWQFQDYGNSSDANPSRLYVWDQIDFYDLHHAYHVNLEVMSPNGCTSSFRDTLTWCFPDTNILESVDEGCIPLSIQFTDNSQFNCPYDYITGRTWDFGNNTTGSGIAPLALYPDTGVFFVFCYIETNKGCVYALADTVQAGEQHVAVSFLDSLPSDTICASYPISVSNLSTDSLYLDRHFLTDFESDNETESTCPLCPWSHQPISKISTDTGWHHVGYTVIHNGCNSPMTMIQDSFYTLPPVGLGEGIYDCDAPNTYIFDISSQLPDSFIGVDHYWWDFGDGSPLDSSPMPITHTYPPGNVDYGATFHTSNDSTGCTYSHSFLVEPRNLVASFIPSATDICLHQSITFDPSPSANYEQFKFLFWKEYFIWNFGDNDTFVYIPGYVTLYDTLSSGPVSHQFHQAGDFDVSLVVFDVRGCIDTFIQTIHVHHPVVPIAASAISGCAPLSITFGNPGLPSGTASSWYWNFGESTTYWGLEPPSPITYYNAGNYTVSLEAIDGYGCSGTSFVAISASDPEADFEPEFEYTCLGTGILFDNLSTSYFSSPNYLWDFGDGNTSIQATPTHTFNDTGTFNISLIIDDGGCLDTIIKEEEITVIDTLIDIIALYDASSCLPVMVEFKPNTPKLNYFNYVWELDGNDAFMYNPMKNFLTSDTHTVVLNMTGGGCELTDTMELNFIKASAMLYLDKQKICKGEKIFFSATAQVNIGGFYFDFGDGYVQYNESPLYHTYEDVSPNGSLYPLLYYWDTENLCKGVDTTSIKVHNVASDFTRGLDDLDSTTCWPGELSFYGSHINGDELTWYFGDGDTLSSQDATHTYDQPGEYYVTFVATSHEYECDVDTSKRVIVYPKPEINPSQNAEVCAGDQVQLYAEGGIEYVWAPDQYIDQTDIPEPTVWPPTSTDYEVIVKTEHDCYDTASVPVFVQQLPTIELHDTSIVVGDNFELSDESIYHVDYQWDPANLVMNPNAYNPVFIPMESQEFYLTMNAYAGDKLCFTAHDTLVISVRWEFSVDVPTLFTPNGDGANDIIEVRGWGIKELLEFQIFNRWGELVFQTNDINQGWDGTFEGKRQPIDTYSYIVRVITHENVEISKAGVFTLAR